MRNEPGAPQRRNRGATDRPMGGGLFTPAPRAASAPARAIQTTGTRGDPLHFYRCQDCFGVFAVENRNERAQCDCGGPLEYLGRAKHDRLIVEGLRVPCDSRCVNARGPKCECGCGGANHGTGALVRVEIDAGGIPTVSRPADLEARRGVAQLFRARLLKAQATYKARIGTVTGYDAAAWQIREQIRAARKFKSQKRRLAAIDAAETMLQEYRRG